VLYLKHVPLSQGCLIGVSVKRGVFQRFSHNLTGWHIVPPLDRHFLLRFCYHDESTSMAMSTGPLPRFPEICFWDFKWNLSYIEVAYFRISKMNRERLVSLLAIPSGQI